MDVHPVRHLQNFSLKFISQGARSRAEPGMAPPGAGAGQSQPTCRPLGVSDGVSGYAPSEFLNNLYRLRLEKTDRESGNCDQRENRT